MQVLLVRQVLERKTIALAFIQTKPCSPFILAEPQHSQYRRAEDRNAVADYVSSAMLKVKRSYQIIRPVHRSG